MIINTGGLNIIGKGQCIGTFAGSGMGKSTLMGMIARNVKADINVTAFVEEIENVHFLFSVKFPKLLEIGSNFENGSITGVYTVLVRKRRYE